MNRDDTPTRVRAVIYARTDRPDSHLSIGDQCESLREYAEQHDMEVVRVYADDDRSGSSLDGRDAMKRLLADVRSPDRDFDVILVHDWTRWGRSLDLADAYHEYLCRRAGVELRVRNEPAVNDDFCVRDTAQCISRALAKACRSGRRPVPSISKRDQTRRRKLWKWIFPRKAQTRTCRP